VLASRSPQRRAILDQLGIRYRVAVPGVEELGEGEPGPLVLENALRKARSVVGATTSARDTVLGVGGDTVLGVDTVVARGGRVYGKPRDEAEAEAFLRDLSGGIHEVHSGLALVGGDGERAEGAVTRVRFRELERADLDWYIGVGEWRERAGAYAIQGRGAALVDEIDGDYSNVVGLPVSVLVRMAPWLFEA
jgi:septum formation protein